MATAFRQSKSSVAGGAGTQVTLTFDSNILANSVIALAITALNSSRTISSVTDSLGNTYTYAGDNPNSGDNNNQMWNYYAEGVSAGACTITVTFDANDDLRRIYAHEITGCATSGALGQHAGQAQATPGTGTDAISSGSVTTTTNGEYIFGCTNANNTQTYTKGTGFTSLREDNTVGATEDLVQSSAGSIAATFTGSGGWKCQTVIMTFKEAASGSSATPAVGTATLSGVAGRMDLGITARTMLPE